MYAEACNGEPDVTCATSGRVISGDRKCVWGRPDQLSRLALGHPLFVEKLPQGLSGGFNEGPASIRTASVPVSASRR